MHDEQGAEHAAALKAFLKILQAEGWLADFFAKWRLEMFAKEPVTPLELIQELTETAINFECDINDAKRMMREWPALFPAQTAEAQEAS